MHTGIDGLKIRRANTILYCRRWQATVAFYRDILELEINLETDWFTEFHIAAGSYVSIADAKRTTIEPAGGRGITLSFQVSDMNTAREQLQAAGIEASEIRQVWGAQAFYIQDPEGHRIEFWQ